MPVLSHGSDLTLAPTIRPVVRQAGGTVRAALDRLSAGGFTAVQLDATLPGIRPRDLDLRSRRDLSGMLSRQNMRLAGLDLFIPRRHFTQPQHMDRAMAAVLAAVNLAADLGKVPVSLALPVKAMGDDAKKALVAAADGHGVRLAVEAPDQVEALLAWVNAVDLHALGAGLDPAAVLGRGDDPVATAYKLGRRLAVARLDDMAMTDSNDDGADSGGSGGFGDSGGAEESGDGDDADSPGAEADAAVRGSGVRSVVGEGDLDVTAYRIAIDLAAGRTGPVVLDLRGMENPLRGAAEARAAWDKAAFRV